MAAGSAYGVMRLLLIGQGYSDITKPIKDAPMQESHTSTDALSANRLLQSVFVSRESLRCHSHVLPLVVESDTTPLFICRRLCTR